LGGFSIFGVFQESKKNRVKIGLWQSWVQKRIKPLSMWSKQMTRLLNMYYSLATQLYINGHNFPFKHWIRLKFLQKILKVLFPIELKFYSNQTLGRVLITPRSYNAYWDFSYTRLGLCYFTHTFKLVIWV